MINLDEHTIYSKYYRFNEFALSSLINNQVWMAHPTTFNDPFDSRIELPSEFAKKVRAELTKEVEIQLSGHENKSKRTMIHKALEYLTDPLDIRRTLSTNGVTLAKDQSQRIQLLYMVADAYQKLGICSFARPKATNHQRLMWAHYADSHRGFSVGYKFTKELIRKQNLNASDVETHDSPPAFPEVAFMNSPDRQLVLEWVMKRIMVKDPIWAYEKEFRLSGEYSNKLIDVPGVVAEFQLGAKMSPNNRKTLVNLITSTSHLKKAEIKEVRQHDDSFEHLTVIYGQG